VAGSSRMWSSASLDWEVTYDADGYLRLLDTFSGHMAMAAWQRDRLYGEIRRRLGRRADGLLHRHWGPSCRWPVAQAGRLPVGDRRKAKQ